MTTANMYKIKEFINSPSKTKSLFFGNLSCCSSRTWALMSRWDVRNHPHSVGGRELRLLLLWERLCVCVCASIHYILYVGVWA